MLGPEPDGRPLRLWGGRRPEERADAARNRARVLAAAERLFAERGATSVSMEDVARAAGVGKGTLYRRHPDRAALAVALLDEHERRLQQRLLDGLPPLRPGRAAGERLAAFYDAMVDVLDRHLDLALAAETGSARFRTGAYGVLAGARAGPAPRGRGGRSWGRARRGAAGAAGRRAVPAPA